MSAYPISLSGISVSAGKSLPHGFTELRGTQFTDGTTIPASGTIQFTNFLNKTIGSPWQIIMRTSGTKIAPTTAFGSPGSSTFKSITASSTGANGRTNIGHAVGLYNAFFTQTGITKIALVSGNISSVADPTAHSDYIIYDLVGSGTGSETLYLSLIHI